MTPTLTLADLRHDEWTTIARHYRLGTATIDQWHLPEGDFMAALAAGWIEASGVTVERGVTETRARLTERVERPRVSGVAA